MRLRLGGMKGPYALVSLLALSQSPALVQGHTSAAWGLSFSTFKDEAILYVHLTEMTARCPDMWDECPQACVHQRQGQHLHMYINIYAYGDIYINIATVTINCACYEKFLVAMCDTTSHFLKEVLCCLAVCESL